MTKSFEEVLRLFLFVFFKIFLRIPGHRKLMWPLAKRFVAGETLDEAITVAKTLTKEGFSVTIAYIGEDEKNPNLIKWTEKNYIDLLSRIAKENLPVDIAIKLSQFDCLAPGDRFFFLIKRVVKRARRYKIRVWIDAEKLRDREPALEVAGHLQKNFGNIGIAVQTYARDALVFITNTLLPLLREGTVSPLSVRICKGAYHEPKELAHREEDDIRKSFLQIILILLLHTKKAFIQIATHDRKILETLRIENFGDSEIGMLYGVEDGLSRQLLAQNKKVRIYVAFGKPWDAFVARRLIEKPRYLKYLFMS